MVEVSRVGNRTQSAYSCNSLLFNVFLPFAAMASPSILAMTPLFPNVEEVNPQGQRYTPIN